VFTSFALVLMLSAADVLGCARAQPVIRSEVKVEMSHRFNRQRGQHSQKISVLRRGGRACGG